MDRNFDNLVAYLEKKCFTKLSTIEDYTIARVPYFDVDDTTIEESHYNGEGIGALDSHYQMRGRISKALLSDVAPGEYYFFVSTNDVDMWNTNNPQILLELDGKIIRAFDTNHVFVKLTPTNSDIAVSMNIYTNTSKKDVFVSSWVAKKDPLASALWTYVRCLNESLAVVSKNIEAWLKLYDVLCAVDKVVMGNNLPEDEKMAQGIQLVEAFFAREKTASTIIEHVVGHTHIDISWLWAIDQTRKKAVRSFSNATYLMAEYPEMTFMSSSPILYEFVKELAPDIYEKIQQYVKDGRWEVEGGMYVESDTNMPSGEALIRQIYYGKKFFHDEFGHENRILWLPDCFGFTGSLPQIMQGCGLDYFFTSKLDWNDTNKMPNDTFMWRGIDGSKVLAHMLTTSDYSETNSAGTTYNGRMNGSQVMGTWSRYHNKDISNHVIQIYGFGDGGGGPTEKMLDSAQVFTQNVPGMPHVEHSLPSRFFGELEKSIEEKQAAGVEVPEWTGEMYFENHRGVFTTDGRVKRLNREAEVAMKQAEFMAVLARVNARSGDNNNGTGKDIAAPYPYEDLESAWKKILVNQFHDILPGTAITKVHEEAVARYQDALVVARKIIETSAKYLSDSAEQNETKKTAFINTTSFTRDYLYENAGQQTLVKNIPAMGVQFVDEAELAKNPASEATLSHFESNVLDNESYRVTFDAYGQISELYAKFLGRNILAVGAVGNAHILYPDHPKEYEAWNIEKDALLHPQPIEVPATVDLLENSPLKTVVEIKKVFRNSELTQRITFVKDSHRIDFATTVNWQEDNTLLKVKFPLAVTMGQATYDVQFGNITRNNYPNNSWDKAKFEVCAQKWSDLSEKEFGVALLNNGKYGHLIFENNMYLSLLRGTNDPAKGIDKGVHEFTYALLPHTGDAHNPEIYREAYALNEPVVTVENASDDLRLPFMLFDAKSSVICETVKMAENKRGVVLRFYESAGKSTAYQFGVGAAVARALETNMLEVEKNNIEIGEGESSIAGENSATRTVTLAFQPYEIKTILLDLV